MGAGVATALCVYLAVAFSCRGIAAAYESIAGNPLNIMDNCQLAAAAAAFLTGSIAALIALWITPAFFPED